MTNRNELIDYYKEGIEGTRISGINLEKERTKEIISRYIGDSERLKILDVGGGVGVYSFWLSEFDHEVHMIDPVPFHIEETERLQKEQKHQLSSISLGDGRDLKFASDQFDVVLLLGPLYHLISKDDRMKALSEAKRVLRQNGLLFAVGISQFASLLDGYFHELISDPAFARIVNQDLTDGQHRNPTDNLNYFTTAYFHHSNDLVNEIESSGFKINDIISIESFFWLIQGIDDLLKNDKEKQLIFHFLKRVEKEQSIRGMSAHIMVVAQRNR